MSEVTLWSSEEAVSHDRGTPAGVRKDERVLSKV